MVVGLPLLLALGVPIARRALRTETPAPSIVKATKRPAAAATAPPPPTLAGLDLTRMDVKDGGVTAPLPDKKTARLAIDPALQRAARRIMASYHLPEAAVVMMDVETGKVLVYASHVEKGAPRDLAVEATAPAASIFKIVTAAALVENAGIGPQQRECYSGGEHKLVQQDLVPDPRRDRWCTTLAGAMGRSINTVFARLAINHLDPPRLDETAKAFGFGSPLAFDVPVQPSAARFPEEPLAFARTAAGFWNTTLSPIHAAWISAAIARGGEPVRPVLVTEVVENGKTQWTAPVGLAQRRIMKPETARALTTMLDTTVAYGTSYRAFHDASGRSFLPHVSVAGKTGTLTDPATQNLYTWFAGFAPSKPIASPQDAKRDGQEPAQPRQVAFAVLVVNGPKWIIKANVLAREMLRAYFASQKVPGVTAPRVAGVRQPRAGGPPATSTTPATKQRRQRGS